MTTGKAIWYAILALVVITALAWLSMGNEFFLYKFFAPKRAAVERQIYKETPSYVDGNSQELSDMQTEYLKSKDKAEKSILASAWLHKADGYGYDKLPSNLKAFYDKLKMGL